MSAKGAGRKRTGERVWGWRIIVRAEEVVELRRNRLSKTLSRSQSAMSGPNPANDCWLRNENAAELSYEATKSGGRF